MRLGMRLRTGIGGLAVLFAAFCLVTLPAAASAMSVAGSGEPAYTKGSSNTWWFVWNRDGVTNYRICFTEYIDNVSQGFEGDGCYSPGGTGGNTYLSHTGLASGHQYTECAVAEEDDLGIGWTAIPGDVSACGTTTMDSSVPVAATDVDGTATYTNDPNMRLKLFYQDTISPPWATGSTFDCWRKNVNTTATPCQNAPGVIDQFQFDPGCSSPAGNGGLNSSWECTYDISNLPGFGDGKWYYCVREADSALPNNSSGPNQFEATSNLANLSVDTPANCGFITLDRVPPQVTAGASPSAPGVGQLITFSVNASDATSGTDGAYQWNFGDNTPAGSGAAPTHTYTQAGTYQVTVTTHDGAGNAGSASFPLQVAGASGGSGGSSPPVTVTNPPTAGSGSSGGTGVQGGTGGSAGTQTQTQTPTTRPRRHRHHRRRKHRRHHKRHKHKHKRKHKHAHKGRS